jgi:hypothetical protein
MSHKDKHSRGTRRAAPASPGPAFSPSDLLTDNEAANFLRLAPHTLRVWRLSHRQPGLRFIRMGRSVRYQFADLVAFIEASKNTVAASA